MRLEVTSKLTQATFNLKKEAEYTIFGETPSSQAEWDNVDWVIGVNPGGTAITTKENPHSELTWTKVKAEMDRIQAVYDAQEYARNRRDEYPNIQELVVALYETEDRSAIDAKRAAVKLKYPKP